MAQERLQKVLAQAGVASRRAAEELITAGRVRVNGKVVRELGSKADPRRDKITVDGKPVFAERHVYYLLHKPRGTVSTTSDPEGRPTVMDLFTGITERIFPVGRLDYTTAGILLFTNDGELAQALLHPRRKVQKTYAVKLRGRVSPQTLEEWRKGIELDDGVTAPAEVSILEETENMTWLRVTIHEGRNRQIHRMGDATGHPVQRLTRFEFAGLSTEGLAPGEYRELTAKEILRLKRDYVEAEVSPAPAGRRAPARTPGPRAAGSAPRRPGTYRPEGERRPAARTFDRPRPAQEEEGGAPRRTFDRPRRPGAQEEGRRPTARTFDRGGPPAEGRRPPGRTFDRGGPPAEGRRPPGRTFDRGGPAGEGRRPEGRRPERRGPEGPRPEGRRPERAGAEGRRPERAGAEGRRPERRGPEGRGQEGRGRAPQRRGPEGRRPEGPGAEGRRPERRGPEERRPAGRGREGQRPERAGADERRPEGRRPIRRIVEGRKPEARRPEEGKPERPRAEGKPGPQDSRGERGPVRRAARELPSTPRDPREPRTRPPRKGTRGSGGGPGEGQPPDEG